MGKPTVTSTVCLPQAKSRQCFQTEILWVILKQYHFCLQCVQLSEGGGGRLKGILMVVHHQNRGLHNCQAHANSHIGGGWLPYTELQNDTSHQAAQIKGKPQAA